MGPIGGPLVSARRVALQGDPLSGLPNKSSHFKSIGRKYPKEHPGDFGGLRAGFDLSE